MLLCKSLQIITGRTIIKILYNSSLRDGSPYPIKMPINIHSFPLALGQEYA